MLQTWRLDSQHMTWVFAAQGNGSVECIYWGLALAQNEDLAQFTAALSRPVTHGCLDTLAPLSLCPEAAQGFQGQAGVVLSHSAGEPVLPQFQLTQSQQQTTYLQFEFIEPTLHLSLQIQLELVAASALRATTTLHNQGTTTWHIQRLSTPVFPVTDQFTHLIDFAGRWCGEFLPQTHLWQMGQWVRCSPEGRTSHGHNPTVLSTTASTDHTQGEVIAWHLGWSGGHRCIAEELQDGRRQVQWGVSDGVQVLAPQADLSTPPLYLAYSQHGLNGVMHTLHQVVRQQVVTFPTPNRPRPVHYNCWEAVYFKHDLATLKTIATKAAALGAERFVLDDGWFKGRHDDRAALGDWVVDTQKYPQGLQPLIQHIHDLGMTFGLWVEPEMINPNSDLYRAHPDWVLGPSAQPLGRHQLALNLANPDVLAYLIKVLDDLLTAYPIEYLKWDHNRILVGGDSQQAHSFYQLLQSLRAKHPQLEIESCSSGGGRIDYGVLQYTQRVWLSDSNDALERWRMQHEAALLLPPEVTGSHVGPRVCHTSGRVLPMSFRAWVAASRHMGFEMDPLELDAEEAAQLTAITQWFKMNRDWYFKGQLQRLVTHDATVLAEMTVAADHSRFVVFIGQIAIPERNSTRIVRLAGLDPQATYRVQAAAPTTLQHKMTRLWNSPLQTNQVMCLKGSTLMQAGLTYPLAFPAHMTVLEGQRI